MNLNMIAENIWDFSKGIVLTIKFIWKYPSVKLCVYKYFDVKRSIILQMRKEEWEEDDKCEIINVDVLWIYGENDDHSTYFACL